MIDDQALIILKMIDRQIWERYFVFRGQMAFSAAFHRTKQVYRSMEGAIVTQVIGICRREDCSGTVIEQMSLTTPISLVRKNTDAISSPIEDPRR